MTRRGILACALAVGFIVPAAVMAEHTRTWRQSDSFEFEKGTAKGVAIRSDGRLMPAPKFTLFCDSNLAYLWALRMDSRGRLYAAGGSDAKVLRFDEAAKPTTVFESAELAAQAIVLDAHDNLYVGTSPDGKVYKVTPDGQKSVFFEPKTKYIWALAVDSAGALFVATGDKGEVFAVNPEGKGQLFYQSDERHARSLAFDSKGNLLIGTDPNGLILRIEIARKNSSATPEAGAAFVIYETGKKEVTSLVADAKGNVYGSSIGEKPRAAGVAPVIPLLQPQGQPQSITSPQGNVTLQLQAQAAAPPAISFPPLPSPTGGAEVVKISPDGSPETLWTSREDLVFAMEQSPAGNILLGTGNRGAILSLEGNNVYSTIAKTASAQVTSLIAGPDGKIFVATANPGKIFALGPGYDADGSFESDTFDAKIFSHWGRLTWWGENGATQGKIAFYVRSGNTSSPEKNWSPWAGPYKNAADATVNCPPARFAQWKAVFIDTDHGGAPNLSWVSLAYQSKNVAPVIDDIAIQDPGVRVQGFAAPTGIGTPTSVQLHLPQRAGSTFSIPGTNPDVFARPSKIDVPPQGFEDKGFASVIWSAHDDNDDDLVFSIYYHGEGERNWRLLKDKLTQRFYSWDTTTMPDGAYYLKIVASDSPSNPPSEALTADRESDRLEIENTPPRVENLRADASAPGVKVTFEGISSSGTIARAQYSVDAGDWLVVFPVGLLSDAPKENYQLQLSGLAPGEHTVAVQIADRFDNSAAAKVTFTVPARTAEHGK
jgi:DNA-binding beta-propeller fold protein YncE